MGGFLTLALIIAVCILIGNDNKKRREENGTTYFKSSGGMGAVAPSMTMSGDDGEIFSDEPAKPKGPKDQTKTLNILLYIGSFLIITAVMAFIANADQNLIAPTVIAITLIAYITGVILYKTVNYLRPVAKSFILTALVIFPLWVFAFEAMKIGWHPSFILSSLFTLIALGVTTFVLESQILAFFFYTWFIIFGWSLIPEDIGKDATYWYYLIPAILSFIPQLMYLMRVKWLPVPLRKATKSFGIGLMPLVTIFALPLFLVMGIGKELPMLRLMIFGMFAIYFFLQWFHERKESSIIGMRVAGQLLVFALLSDILNYSLLDSFSSNADFAVCVTMAIIWAVSFLIQNILSLFARHDDSNLISIEHLIEVGSIIAIILTPALCNNLDATAQAIVRVVVYLIVAALGVVYSLVRKNVYWSLATLAGLFLIPFQIGSQLVRPAWDGWGYAICYAIISCLILVDYAYLRHVQEKESLTVATVGLIISDLIVVASTLDVRYASVGWIFSAASFAILGLLSGEKVMYELSIWMASFCVYSLAGEIYRATEPVYGDKAFGVSGYTDQRLAILSAVRIHALALAPIATCIWREREEGKPKLRLLLAYLILTGGMYSLGVVGHYGLDDHVGYTIMFLFEQLAFLITAALIRCKWLNVCSIIGVLVGAFHLTGGFNYVWLGIAGVALIAFVTWQLSKTNQEAKNNGTTTPKPGATK